MRFYSKNREIKLQKILLIGIPILIVVYGAIAYATTSFPFNINSNNETQETLTEEEIRQAQDKQQKQENIESQEKPSNPSPSTNNLVITEMDSENGIVSVRAYLAGISEDGGVCTVIFSKQNQEDIISVSQAFGDTKTTQCGANDTNIEEFKTRGDWNVTVEYKSASTTTTSSGTISL